MGEAALVEPSSVVTRKLLERLDRSQVPVDAAFWLLHDGGQWKLYLHTPLIEKKSRTQAYRAIQNAIAGLTESVAVQDVNLLRENDPLLRNMRMLVSTSGQGIHEIRLRQSVVNGLFIDEAIAYRL